MQAQPRDAAANAARLLVEARRSLASDACDTSARAEDSIQGVLRRVQAMQRLGTFTGGAATSSLGPSPRGRGPWTAACSSMREETNLAHAALRNLSRCLKGVLTLIDLAADALAQSATQDARAVPASVSDRLTHSMTADVAISDDGPQGANGSASSLTRPVGGRQSRSKASADTVDNFSAHDCESNNGGGGARHAQAARSVSEREEALLRKVQSLEEGNKILRCQLEEAEELIEGLPDDSFGESGATEGHERAESTTRSRQPRNRRKDRDRYGGNGRRRGESRGEELPRSRRVLIPGFASLSPGLPAGGRRVQQARCAGMEPFGADESLVAVDPSQFEMQARELQYLRKVSE